MKKQNSAIVKQRNIFKSFATKANATFNVATLSVYAYEKGSDKEAVFIFGKKIESSVVNERYCCFSSSVVLTNPVGLPEAPEYKSRLVTRLFVNKTAFVVVFSSFALEAFKRGNAERILEMLKGLTLETLPFELLEKKGRWIRK